MSLNRFTGTLAVGLAGVGYIGTVHRESVRGIDGAEVVAAMDAAAAGRDRAERLGVPNTYDTCADLLAEESLDVLVVATPPSHHARATTLAAREGVHVFVEKPLGRTAAEGKRIVRAAEDADVHLGVDHSFRYEPAIRRVARRYREGRLGHVPVCQIRKVNNNHFSEPPVEEPLRAWPMDPDVAGGGAVLDIGVHLLDVLRWLFGELDVRHVELDRQLELPVEDTATVCLRAERTDTICLLTCGWYQWQVPPDVNSRLRLEGIAGWADSRDHEPDEFTTYAATSALENVWRRLSGRDPRHFEPTYYYRSHFDALSEFLQAVREDRAPPVSGRDGLAALELVADIYDRAAFDPAPEVPVTAERP